MNPAYTRGSFARYIAFAHCSPREAPDSEYESVRELTVSIKKQGIGLNDLVCSVRLNNYIQKLGANQDQIESFIVNYMNSANSLPPEKIINLTKQLFDIAKCESISPTEVPVYSKQRLEEKQWLTRSKLAPGR